MVSSSSADRKLFQKNLTTAARALSGGATVPDSVLEPNAAPNAELTAEEQQHLRGASDARALYLRYHQTAHQNEAPSSESPGPRTQAVLETLEQARCESYGSRHLPGTRANLQAQLSHRLQTLETANMAHKADMPAALALELLTREALTNTKLPENLVGPALQQWRDALSPESRALLAEMQAAQHEQSLFQHLSRKFLEKGLSAPARQADQQAQPSNRQDPEETKPPSDSTPTENAPPPSPDEPQAPAAGTSEEAHDPQAEEEAGSLAPDDQDALPTAFQPTASDSLSAEELETLLADGENGEEEGAGAGGAYSDHLSSPFPEAYHVYTRAYDEEILASALCASEELAELREELDAHTAQTQDFVTRLAHRLQRKLQAQQQRHWSFDQDDGLLDAARLPRIISNPGLALSYKQESETDFRDTVVTLLLDNSGSMRGRPIETAALCADILGRTLERCGVKVEVLGFTTRAWKGGQSRKHWLAEDRPAHPGRLNDLRHIIYKAADMPWRRARRNLGVMLKEGLLKENIDGEALLWAARRLAKRSEKRRILMVISDGAPVDDSTASANGPEFLEAHLQEVVTSLEGTSSLELLAIGIGHDVTRTYANSITIRSANDLGEALLQQLTALFTPPKKRGSTAQKRP